MFSDSDLVALVHDREFTPRVAAVAEDAPGLRGTVVIDDGSEAGTGDGTDYEAALAAASPDRDFPPRSNDDVYILYTGGTTGYPEGRDVAPRGHLAHARRRHRLHHRQSRSLTSGSSPAAAWRAPGWSGCARRRSSTGRRRWGR